MKEIRPNKNGVFPQVVNASGTFLGYVALGNSTQYRIGFIKSARGIFIGIEGRGSYEFTGLTHAGYLQEKLGLKYEGDAANVADFVNDQIAPGSPRQGHYQESLCREPEEV